MCIGYLRIRVPPYESGILVGSVEIHEWEIVLFWVNFLSVEGKYIRLMSFLGVE